MRCGRPARTIVCLGIGVALAAAAVAALGRSNEIAAQSSDNWLPRRTTPPPKDADGWTVPARKTDPIRQAKHEEDDFVARQPGGPQLPDPKPIEPKAVEPKKDEPKPIEPKPLPVPTLPPPRDVKSPPKKPDARAALVLSAARNAVARGALAEGLAGFEEYLRAFPDDGDVRREYAGILVQAGRLAQAERQFRAVLATDPNNPETLAALGDVYLIMKAFRRAVGPFEKALAADPENRVYAVKLCRALAYDGDLIKAYELFDRAFGRLPLSDPRLPKSFGALLIDLGMPTEALIFLRPLRNASPDDLEVRAYLIHAHARLGERIKAMEMIAEMGGVRQSGVAVRLELAESLYQETDFELAAQVFSQVLQADPKNVIARIGLARVTIARFQPSEAFHLLEGIVVDSAPARRLLALTWAEFHQLVGEYIAAKQIYKDFLEWDSEDTEARLALARLYEFVREEEKAMAEYSKVCIDGVISRAARIGIVSCLLAQRKFFQAIECARSLVADFPADGESRALLVRVLSKASQPDAAESAARTFLQSNPRFEPAVIRVRLALAQALLDAGRMPEAAREFENVLTRPEGRQALAYYGMFRTRLVGPQIPSRVELDQMAAQLGGKTRVLLLLSDLYAADFDDANAMELCVAALKCDPNNLAVLIRLADLKQREAIRSGNNEEALAVGQQVLVRSPTNVRGLLATARSHSIVRHFKQAVSDYNRLIAADQEYTIPKREKAEALYSDNAFAASHAAYMDLQHPLPAEVLTEPRIEVPSAARSVIRDPSGLPDNEMRRSPMIWPQDIHARQVEAEGAMLEDRAKQLKGWRNYASIPVYKDLLTLEPANSEAQFDLGQVCGSLKQTKQEMMMYSGLLATDPRHRDAAIALERAGLELQPQLWTNFDYFNQRGRDGLASIDRYRFQTVARLPFGDEDEYAEMGLAKLFLDPTQGQRTNGNVLSVRVQGKPDERLLLWGQGNAEFYDDNGFHDRPTFDIGARYEPDDLFRVYTSGFLENVAENGGSIAQDIYRYGVRVGGDVRPSRRVDIGASYAFAEYSDSNASNDFVLYGECLLTFLPTQLKLVGRVEYLEFAKQTVFNPNQPGNVLAAQYPYFSPNGYGMYEGRIEWLHYLSRDFFTHANTCYYGLQYGCAFDSRFVMFNRFRALFHYDVKPWLTIEADVNATISDAYKNVGASAFLVLRMPHFHR